MKWYKEKRLQHMNENGQIDNLSVWMDQAVVVPSTTILEDDILTHPSNDLIDMFVMGETVVQLTAYDITIKHGSTNSPSKRYKFNYILGNTPEYTFSMNNNIDTIVQISRGDTMMRVIVIGEDGIPDIQYKPVNLPTDEDAPQNPQEYAFCCYLNGAYYIATTTGSVTSATKLPLYYSTNLVTFKRVNQVGGIPPFLVSSKNGFKISYGNFIAPSDSTRWYSAFIYAEGVSCFLSVKRNSDLSTTSLKYVNGLNVASCGHYYYPTTYTISSTGIHGIECHQVVYDGTDVYIINDINSSTYVPSLKKIVNDLSSFSGMNLSRGQVFFPMSNVQTGRLCVMYIQEYQSKCEVFEVANVNNVDYTTTPQVLPTLGRTSVFQLKNADAEYIPNFERVIYYNIASGKHSRNRDVNVALYSPSTKYVEFLHFNTYKQSSTYLNTWENGHSGLYRASKFDNYMEFSHSIQSQSQDDKRYSGEYEGTGSVSGQGMAKLTITKPTGAPSCTEWDIVYINCLNGDHAILFPKAGWGFSMYGSSNSRVLFMTDDISGGNTGMQVTASSITIRCKHGASLQNYDNQSAAVMNASGVIYKWSAET